MTGVATRFEIEGLVNVGLVLGRLSQLDLSSLADKASAYLISSTQDRITGEQTSPEGDPWAPWSPDYAATRHGNQSLLVGGGDLRDSLKRFSSGTEIGAGSNLEYAAVHQFGSDDGSTPARPYLGLSPLDQREIEQMALDLFGEALG